MDRRLKSALMLVAIIGTVYAMSGKDSASTTATAVKVETYRLVHAIGNDETIVAKDLSKRECEMRKRDNIYIAEALGIHSERLGIGSITCLRESDF